MMPRPVVARPRGEVMVEEAFFMFSS